MITAFWMLLGVIAATPALIFGSGYLIDGVLASYLAVATAALAFSIRAGESDHLVRLIQPTALIIGCLFLWMIIQAAPMPMAALGHPIWGNAQSALGEPLSNRITIDVGATVISISRLCVVGAMFFIAAATCVDRARAETILNVLTFVASLFALALIASELATLLSPVSLPPSATTSLTAITDLGVVITAANIVRIIERYETRKLTQNISVATFGVRLGGAVCAFFICFLAAVFFATPPVLFSTGSGFLVFIMILLIRRLGFRVWEAIGLLAVVIAALGLVASLNAGTGDLSIRFAHLGTPTKAILSTMIANVPAAGNGAGTFSSIMPIYQDAGGDLTANAGTTAAISVIELGRAVTWLLLISAIFVIGLLAKAALTRGRDSFYPTAGVSCLVILLLESFCDGSLLLLPNLVVSASTLGLAMAQRLSRTDGSRLSVA